MSVTRSALIDRVRKVRMMEDNKESGNDPLPKEGQGGKSVGGHPSRNLLARSRGFGIGGGYERPYRREKPKPADSDNMYGPLPHAGYYGAGADSRPFKRGQAGFSDELSWYRSQYGEKTSGYEKRKG